jgi:hypothetical protein
LESTSGRRPSRASFDLRPGRSTILTSTTSVKAAPRGFVEEHLKIVLPKEVELADENPSATLAAENHAE